MAGVTNAANSALGNGKRARSPSPPPPELPALLQMCTNLVLPQLFVADSEKFMDALFNNASLCQAIQTRVLKRQHPTAQLDDSHLIEVVHVRLDYSFLPRFLPRPIQSRYTITLGSLPFQLRAVVKDQFYANSKMSGPPPRWVGKVGQDGCFEFKHWYYTDLPRWVYEKYIDLLDAMSEDPAVCLDNPAEDSIEMDAYDVKTSNEDPVFERLTDAYRGLYEGNWLDEAAKMSTPSATPDAVVALMPRVRIFLTDDEQHHDLE